MAVTIKLSAVGQDSIIYPAGIVAGDLILLGGGSYNTGLATPSGYTLITSNSTSSTYYNYGYLWYKIATGTESGLTITPTGGASSYKAFNMLVITGHDSASPIHTYNSAIAGFSTFTTGSVTTTTNSQRYFFFTEMGNNGLTQTFSLTSSGQTLIDTIMCASGSYYRSAAYLENAVESAGTYSGATISSTDNGAGVGIVVAIKQGNVSPTAPTNLVPANSAIGPVTNTTTFTWTHNDAEGDAQTAAEISYRVKGSTGAYVVITSNSATQAYTFAANTFTDGQEYEYIIRTKDAGSGSYGAYSATTYFTAGKSLWSYGPTVTSSTQSGILNTPIYTNGFETQMTGWESNNVFGTYVAASVARTTVRAKTGTYSLQVNWPTGFSWVDINVAGLTIGKTYTLSADVYVPTGAPNVQVDPLFASVTTPSPTTVITTKDAWVTTSCTFVANATSMFLGVKMAAGQTGTSGQVMYIDNFSAQEVLPPTGTYYVEVRTADAQGFGPWSAQSPTFVVSPASNIYIKQGGVWKLSIANVRQSGTFKQVPAIKKNTSGVFN